MTPENLENAEQQPLYGRIILLIPDFKSTKFIICDPRKSDESQCLLTVEDWSLSLPNVTTPEFASLWSRTAGQQEASKQLTSIAAKILMDKRPELPHPEKITVRLEPKLEDYDIRDLFDVFGKDAISRMILNIETEAKKTMYKQMFREKSDLFRSIWQKK